MSDATERPLTWREHCVIRILLCVARLVAPNADARREIQTLANHIAFRGERN